MQLFGLLQPEGLVVDPGCAQTNCELIIHRHRPLFVALSLLLRLAWPAALALVLAPASNVVLGLPQVEPATLWLQGLVALLLVQYSFATRPRLEVRDRFALVLGPRSQCTESD